MGAADDSPNQSNEYGDAEYDQEGKEQLMNPDENYEEYADDGQEFQQFQDYQEEQGYGNANQQEGNERYRETPNKPKKRLVRHSARDFETNEQDDGYGDEYKDDVPAQDDHYENYREESREGRKEKRMKIKSPGKRKHGKKGRENDGENEMWNSLAGAEDSEDDREGKQTEYDNAFIDDAGADAYHAQAYDDEDDRRSIGDAPQAEEEDDELKRLFKKGKKRKSEKSMAEIGMIVEDFINKMEIAAEEDAELNRNRMPALEKLKMISEVRDMLTRKPLQNEFLDRGVLTTLKNWLEPLPDGSLPNIKIRASILTLLTELPIDVGIYDRREQLKQSGLGRSVMFLSKLPEETSLNQKLARNLVEMWSRPIFEKSTRYEDLRQYDDERPLPRRLRQDDEEESGRSKATGADDEVDLDNRPNQPKPGEKGYRLHAFRPQPMALDFVVRPVSRVTQEDIQKSKAIKEETMHDRMNKKLQKLAGNRRKNLRAERVSVEGRGLIRYI